MYTVLKDECSYTVLRRFIISQVDGNTHKRGLCSGRAGAEITTVARCFTANTSDRLVFQQNHNTSAD
jgi:hypothetical protein